MNIPGACTGTELFFKANPSKLIFLYFNSNLIKLIGVQGELLDNLASIFVFINILTAYSLDNRF